MNIKSKIPEVQEILKSISDDHISESSAECAYYVILSFVPFAILVLQLIKYTGIDAMQLFNILSEILPKNMNELVMGIIKEIYSKSFGTISISVIFILYSASKGLYALIKGLHSIYKYSETKKRSALYLRLLSLLNTIVFIILIAIALIALVFGKTIVVSMQENFGVLENFTFLSEILTRLIFIVIVFGVFLLVYKFVPGNKNAFKSQVWGALFASIALNVISILISYINVFYFTISYASLTAIFTIMIWSYFVFYIIFLGAEINKFINIRKDKKVNNV